ncbi:MAG: lipid-A-disaccharide synthase [Bryobacteraceae bacterium]|nr:lipid-A-disaccharide synthase [Bryobacteraceae bacterium]
MPAPKILISAGEASGDLYAARLVEALKARFPDASFFGCAGPRMKEAGVRPVVDASSLAVVGLVEVVSHIPRIYGEYRKILETAARERPALAVLTDSPDFHLRVARRLRRLDIPVVFLVAPQVWAWRKGRIRALRRYVDRLLCIFPFEEEFFRPRGVRATYVGHPLARLVKPSMSREQFFRQHRIPQDRPMVVLLPGSRRGEIGRHLPELVDAAARLARQRAVSLVMALPAMAVPAAGDAKFWEPIQRSPIQVVEGQTWDAIAHADLALAASGTVTIEAALLGAPMVTFYRVTGLSWLLGRFLVDVPFFSMVNLVAGKQIVPELMQNEMRGERLAREAGRLLSDSARRQRMKEDLAVVAARLAANEDPLEKAASLVEDLIESTGNVS